ncbi:STAS domain-containing protein [Kitasatospora sp. NPDC101157]|uniref:STAS domain-containing protein n=1 Tax=Kitasatospora sp. NPDC101157 TaxID=3364098 RepID=UPI0038235737
MTPTASSGTDDCPLGNGATLTVQRSDGVVVAALAGELDLDSVDVVRLDPAVLSGATHLLFDLAELDFCDSSGLNALLRLRAEAAQRGIEVGLCAPGERVRMLLRVTGTDQVFPLHPSVEAALAATADPTAVPAR